MNSKVLRKIVAIILLIMMSVSYIPNIVIAANEENSEGKSEYVDFVVNNNSTETINVITGNTMIVPYKLILSGVATGFQNVTVSVYQNPNKSDGDTGILSVIYEEVSSSKIMGSTLQFNGTQNTVNLNSNFKFTFSNNESKTPYDTVVTVYLSGTYKDPLTKEDVVIGIERDINVHVEPANLINFEYNIGVGRPYYNYIVTNGSDLIEHCLMGSKPEASENKNKYIQKEISLIPDEEDMVAYNAYEWEKFTEGYQRFGIAELQYLHRYVNNAYYEEYEFLLTRDKFTEDEENINSEEKLIIDLSEFEENGFLTEVVRNQDGTTIIRLKKGKEIFTDFSDLYTSDDGFGFKIDYYIPEAENVETNKEISTKLEMISFKIKGYETLADGTSNEVESNDNLKSEIRRDIVTNDPLYPDFCRYTTNKRNYGKVINRDRLVNGIYYIKETHVSTLRSLNDITISWRLARVFLENEVSEMKIENLYNTSVIINDNGQEIKKIIPKTCLRITNVSISYKSSNVENIILKSGDKEYNLDENNEINIPAEDNISKQYLNIELDGTKEYCEIGYEIQVELILEELEKVFSEEEIENIVGFVQGCMVDVQLVDSIPTYPSDAYPGDISCLNMTLNEYDNYIGKSNPELILSMKPEMDNSGMAVNINGEVKRIAPFYSKNTNPKIYVELAEDFIWEVENISMSFKNPFNSNEISAGKEKNNIKIKDYYRETIDGVNYLVIDCEGVYAYENDEIVDISIKFNREATQEVLNEEYVQKVYMFTEEDHYRKNGGRRILDNTTLIYKDTAPSKVFSISEVYNLDIDTKETKMESIIISNREYSPMYINEENYTTSVKEKPVVVNSGNTVTYVNELTAGGNANLTNIGFVIKLPKIGATSVQSKYSLLSDDNEEDGIDGYVLPEKFFTKKIQNFVGTVNPTSAVPEISMLNLSNIKVSNNNNEYMSYSLYYTEIQNVDFTTVIGEDPSTSFVKVTDTTDLSNATALKVVMNEDFELLKNQKLEVSYDMTMPDTDGMVGQVAAVTYIENEDENYIIQEPIPAYVIRGNTNGGVEITKKFEGYDVGEIPEELTTLAGIGFKLLNDNAPLIIDGVTDENGVVLTDENGVATFTNVPEGIYRIVEVTEFENYSGIDWTEVLVKQGEITEKTVENKIKTSNVTIKKSFEDTNEILGEVIFKITRTTETDDIEFSDYIEVDGKTGIGTLENVPYGEYKIEESTGIHGWYTEPLEGVVINNPEQTVNIENKLAKGTIVINKTVPEGDTVDGLKFEIVCVTPITYTNKQGEEVVHSVNQIVEVGGQNAANVQIQNNGENVVITVSDLPAGTYTITEVELPQIETTNGVQVDRYEIAKGVTTISENEEIKTVLLTNLWKMGRLHIKKTAEKGVDLEQFAVRVTGTSYYGTQVDKTLYLNSDGEISTTLEIGNYKVEEIESDYFDAEYSNDGITYSKEAKTYEVEANTLTTAYIKNNSTYGYVRINKTLEDKETSAAQGIKFYVQGISPTGANIKEEIIINENGTGISGPIPAGGEYVLVEDELTIPSYYVGIEEKEVEITKHNTENVPLVFDLENVRGKGNLQLKTTTNPEGEVPYPITYKIAEINILEDGSYEFIEGTEKTIEADLQGEAGFVDLPSGLYLAWHESIPDGWEKDLPQIVEVPVDNTGIAIFEITRKEEWQKTKVVISKEIYNEQGTMASEEDFEYAKLNSNESFEVQLKNVETHELYYVFVSKDNNGIITGLEPGKYEIMENEKFKYENIGIFEKSEFLPELQKENEKYIFEIPDVEGVTVELIVRNRINTDFGFGGSTQKDNYSKIDSEVINSEMVTKAVIYVVDEQGKTLPGATFKIIDSQGQEVQISAAGNEITTTGNRVVIKGLQVGTYTFVNTSVPNGYIQAPDTVFTVYKEATRVVRIEIQKNVVRGNLLLSTVYENEDGEMKYTSRSKYKILNTDTNEFVKFIKKADGSYVKSNLPNAVDIISLKAGKMSVSGIETGNYEIGLVDVTEGYGIVKNTVEEVSIVNSEVQEVSVEVMEKKIVDIAVGYRRTFMLDSDGNVWVIGASGSENGTGNSSSDYYVPVCLNTIEAHPFNNLKIVKISAGHNKNIAIDEYGRVWTWGYGQLYENISLTSIPVCISDEETEVFYNKKIIDVAAGGNDTNIAIDDNGNVYTWGNKYNLGIDYDYQNNISENYVKPICINTAISNHPLYGVKAVKCEVTGSNVFIILDEQGRIWTWAGGIHPQLGYNPKEYSESYQPACISEIIGNSLSEAYKQGIEIVDISANSSYGNLVMALDSQGRIWTWGRNEYGGLGNGTQVGSIIPICLNEQECNKNTIANLKFIEISGGRDFSTAVDEYGRVWTWGRNNYGTLGTTSNSNSVIPVCISDDSNEKLSETKIVKIFAGNEYTIAIDNKNELWGWGYNYYGESGSVSNNTSQYSYTRIPSKCNYSFTYNEVFAYNFEISKVASSEHHTIMLDTNGKIWGMGESEYLGIGEKYGYGSDINAPIYIEPDSNAIFVDIAVTYYNSILLDNEGKVWTTGGAWNGTLGNNDTSNNKDNYICISDLEGNPLKGVKIEKIYGSSNGFRVIALDENGKIWTWGYDYRYGTQSIPVCLTDMADTELNNAYKNGVYMVKVDAVDSYNTVALDSEGKVWTWGDSSLYGNDESVMKCITDIAEAENGLYNAYQTGIRAIDVGTCSGAVYVIDSNGKLWSWGYNEFEVDVSTDKPICISEIDGNKFKELSENNVKLLKIETGYSHACVIDDKGRLWVFGNVQNQFNVPDSVVTCITEEKSSTIYNLSIKNIFAGYDSTFIIDEDGEIWVTGNNDNGQLGIRSTVSINNPQNMYGKLRNLLYKVKAIDVVKGEYSNSEVVIDENYNEWTIGNKAYISGTTTKEKTKEDLEEKGLIIVEFIEEDDYSIGLDSEGKVWISGYIKGIETYIDMGENRIIQEFTCLNKLVDDKVVIKDIGCSGDGVILLSEDGKIYTLGYYWSKNNEYKFDNVTNISEVKIDSFLGSVALVESNGDIWLWGYRSGFNLETTEYFLSEITKVVTADNVEIDEVICVGRYFFYKDTDGNLWTVGSNQYGQCGDGTTVNRTTPFNTEIKVDKVYVSGHSIFVLDIYGDVWVAGQNTNYQLGTGDNVNKATFVNITSSISSIVDKYSQYLIDVNGQIYSWGSSLRSYRPICLTNVATNILYRKYFKAYSNGVIQTTDGNIYNSTTLIGNSTKTMVGYDSTSVLYKTLYIVKYDDGTFEVFKDNSATEEFKTMIDEIIELIPYVSEMTAEEIADYISSGYYLTDNGKLYLWGTSSSEYFEDLLLENQIVCVNEKQDSILYGKTIKAVVKDSYYTYVVDSEGNVYVWGRKNYLGQISTETDYNYYPTNLSEIDELADAALNHGWYITLKKYGF